MLGIGLALLFILSCVPFTARGSGWTKVEVDSGGGAAGIYAWTSLALDGNDAVHISYRTDTYPEGSSIKYATNSSGTWSTSTIEQMSMAYWRTGTSTTIDKVGSPHVVYSNGTEIKHAFLSSGSWVKETLSSEGLAYGVDSANDLSGQLRACYFESDGSVYFNLTHAYRTPSGWNSTVIVTNQSMNSISMLVDNQGKTRICYTPWTASAGDFTAWYARLDGGVETISEVYPNAVLADMAIDSKRDCHVVFIDRSGDTDRLMYISSNNGTWQPSSLTSIDDRDCWDPSITIDSKNKVYVSYTAADGDLTLLRCAVKTSDGWKKQTIDKTSTSDIAFVSTSIAVDSAGIAHISYWRGSASYLDPDGGLMFASGIVSTGESPIVIVGLVVLAAVAISCVVFVLARRKRTGKLA
jgi:hypothetical protein